MPIRDVGSVFDLLINTQNAVKKSKPKPPLSWDVYVMNRRGKTRAQGGGEYVGTFSTFREAKYYIDNNASSWGKDYNLIVECSLSMKDKKGSKPKFSSTMQSQKSAKDRSPEEVPDLLKELALSMEKANEERLEKLCQSK